MLKTITLFATAGLIISTAVIPNGTDGPTAQLASNETVSSHTAPTGSFSLLGASGLKTGDVVTDAHLRKLGLSQKVITQATANFDAIEQPIVLAAAKKDSPVYYSWSDKHRKTVTLRANINTKINDKHNINWRVARVVTQFPKALRYNSRTATGADYWSPAQDVQCSGILWWRKCRVVRTVEVYVRVDFRTNTALHR